jgi:hypothetical protein
MSATTMQVGRELDALVAERVMGKVFRRYPLGSVGAESMGGWEPFFEDGTITFGGPPRYSADMADAWAVVEAMRGRGWRIDLAQASDDSWGAEFYRLDSERTATAQMDTAALAICRAALAAVEVVP